MATATGFNGGQPMRRKCARRFMTSWMALRPNNRTLTGRMANDADPLRKCVHNFPPSNCHIPLAAGTYWLPPHNPCQQHGFRHDSMRGVKLEFNYANFSIIPICIRRCRCRCRRRQRSTQFGDFGSKRMKSLVAKRGFLMAPPGLHAVCIRTR